MERDLQVHSEDVSRLRQELVHVVEFFRGKGCERCDVLFGWAWRTSSDTSGLAWRSLEIPLLKLVDEIHEAERAALGEFAGDDVFVTFAGCDLKLQFCHESGIHLFFSEPNETTLHFLNRWQAAGLSPAEFEKADGSSLWQRTGAGG